MPCKVKKIPKTDTQTPIIHLLMLLKNALNLLIFSSFERFPAMEKQIIVIVNGKTSEVIIDTIFVEKKATAGRQTATDAPPPLVAIKVNKIG